MAKVLLPIAVCLLWGASLGAADAPTADPARQPETTVAAIAGYKLVWNDEFDKDGAPDAAKWNFEHGFCRNNELQWYQAENAVCRGGLLVIEGRRERVANPNYDAKSGDWKRNREFAEWTASSLNTWGKFDWPLASSIIVVRARLTPQPGYFPAIWTTGPGIWPHGGEVDLMECYGGRVLANFAWGTRQKWGSQWHSYDSPNQPDKNKPKISYFVGKDPDWLSKFHVWKLVGSADKMQIFCDDDLLNEVTQETAKNPKVDFADVVYPFREKHGLILNLAIGGPGGDASKATSPMLYEVDYARVYAADQP